VRAANPRETRLADAYVGHNQTIMNEWVINIDMEGFSYLWEKEDRILLSLGELMSAIFRIGRRCYSDYGDRLFVHQIGDGFIIKSDIYEENLERPLSIASALMQHVASTGRFAKATIAEGDLPDIKSCYPREVLDNLGEDNRVRLGRGLMTIFPVMGTALINSIKVAKDSPRGPLLTLEASFLARIPSIFPTKSLKGKKYDLLSVDWVHAESALLKDLKQKAGLAPASIASLEAVLMNYCKEHDHELPARWKANCRRLLRLPGCQKATPASSIS
jgi:hypothetical protein